MLVLFLVVALIAGAVLLVLNAHGRVEGLVLVDNATGAVVLRSWPILAELSVIVGILATAVFLLALAIGLSAELRVRLALATAASGSTASTATTGSASPATTAGASRGSSRTPGGNWSLSRASAPISAANCARSRGSATAHGRPQRLPGRAIRPGPRRRAAASRDRSAARQDLPQPEYAACRPDRQGRTPSRNAPRTPTLWDGLESRVPQRRGWASAEPRSISRAALPRTCLPCVREVCRVRVQPQNRDS